MRAALVISDRDNVATALERLDPGRSIEIGGRTLSVRETIPSGHKIALRPIAAGEAVFKYGSPIGLADADIAEGAHVHTHNLSSSRGRGDLERSPAEVEQRLAEPSDDGRADPGIMPASKPA